MTDAAAALGVRLSTMSGVVKDLVRKRWVTKRRSVTDTRVVHLRLSRREQVITRKIENQVRRVSTGGAANKDLTADGLNLNQELVKQGWCWWYRKYAPGIRCWKA